jgi:8-oxo-dGTP diphosphatase
MPGPIRQDLIATTDVVLLTLADGALSVLLTRRAHEPFAGALALPGVILDPVADREGTEAAARRALRDKVGEVRLFLEQLFTFSGPDRDPRGWSLSVAYFGLVAVQDIALRPDVEAEMVPVDSATGLAFDHDRILATAVRRLRNKSSYSSLPCYLLPELFTLPDLLDVYQRVLGERLDQSSFRRKILELGIVKPVKGRMAATGRRPAQLYRMARDRLTEFDRTI